MKKIEMTRMITDSELEEIRKKTNEADVVRDEKVRISGGFLDTLITVLEIVMVVGIVGCVIYVVIKNRIDLSNYQEKQRIDNGFVFEDEEEDLTKRDLEIREIESKMVIGGRQILKVKTNELIEDSIDTGNISKYYGGCYYYFYINDNECYDSSIIYNFVSLDGALKYKEVLDKIYLNTIDVRVDKFDVIQKNTCSGESIGRIIYDLKQDKLYEEYELINEV